MQKIKLFFLTMRDANRIKGEMGRKSQVTGRRRGFFRSGSVQAQSHLGVKE